MMDSVRGLQGSGRSRGGLICRRWLNGWQIERTSLTAASKAEQHQKQQHGSQHQGSRHWQQSRQYNGRARSNLPGYRLDFPENRGLPQPPCCQFFQDNEGPVDLLMAMAIPIASSRRQSSSSCSAPVVARVFLATQLHWEPVMNRAAR